MPICIECRYPVRTLWTEYSGAGDTSSGHNIRLTVCRNCGQFCDKYVEHDFVVIFIDLVLIKPQVYRHLLHNTLMLEGDQFAPSIVRLGVLLLLFDVYLTWARIERQSRPGAGSDGSGGPDSSDGIASATTDSVVSAAGAAAAAAAGSVSSLFSLSSLRSSYASLSSSWSSLSAVFSSSSSPPPSSLACSLSSATTPSTLSTLSTPSTPSTPSSAPPSLLPAVPLAPSSSTPLSSYFPSPHSSSSAATQFLQNPADITATAADIGRLAQQPIVFQYIFFLVLCALSTLAFHMSIRFLTSSPLSPLVRLRLLPRFQRPNSVSTALLVSSSTKLFPILMVIWDYDVPAAARSLGWAVVVNNIEALKILLDCGYGTAAFLAMAGALSRWAISRLVLWIAGLGDIDGAGESSVADDGRALWAVVLMLRDWAGRLAVG